VELVKGYILIPLATEFVPEHLQEPEGKPPFGGGGRLWVWPRVVCVVLFFAGLELLLFHTGLYSAIVEPDSSTGFMELQLRNEIKRPKPNRNQVLAVGHSRMALMPRISNEMQPGTGYTFASIGLGGTTPRTWYYALRAVDPTARNYAAIVIPTDDFNEPDTYDYQSERETDLHYLIARLGFRDLFEFPWTYQSDKLKWVAFRGILLKGFVYKRDFLEFLEDPMARIAKARYYARDSAGWYYGYGGVDKSLAGLEIDWLHKTIEFPDRIPEDERKQVQGTVFPILPPDAGRETAYLRYWYGRILDHYRGSGTKIFFLRVPRAPVSPPDPAPKLNSAVRQIASQPDVVVLDEHLFDQLEHPDLFWDAQHLNREGSERFSLILATEVQKALGPPQT
jgi:hypothetical protein